MWFCERLGANFTQNCLITRQLKRSLHFSELICMPPPCLKLYECRLLLHVYLVINPV